MKLLVGMLIGTHLLTISGWCQDTRTVIKEPAAQMLQTARCSQNPDRNYDRQVILELRARTLNVSVFGDKSNEFEYSVEKERPIRFFVHDLTDTSNIGTPLSDCVSLKDRHVYHFAPIRSRRSLSHILYLEKGSLKIFRSLNCDKKGESVQDVLAYVTPRLEDFKNREEIFERIKNYRKYGIYYSVDAPTVECNDSI